MGIELNSALAPVPVPARSRRLLLWSAAGCALAALAALWLVPAASTHAAGSTDSPSDAVPGGATNFGSATPNDKFVQSFQQQVSQELQSALAQANQAQESRLQKVLQDQQALNEKLQAMQQGLQANAKPAAGDRSWGARAPDFDLRSTEAPQVNVRRASNPDATDAAASGPQSSTGGALGGWLSGIRSNSGDPEAASTDRSSMAAGLSAGAIPGASLHAGRAGEPNIAPHGFVEGRLLNGVVAVVGGPDRESIVALTGGYQSANGFIDDLDGCFALVQGKPEIAAGRIDFKLSRLTCNFEDGASRTWDTAGWLVDADGIRGVRARIVENASRKAAVAAMGGALNGIGQRLSQEQYQINSISGGLSGGPVGTVGTSSTFIGSPAGDALGGAASGAASALSQSISDYYNLYSPSLQVGGGTPVTVVLANDLRLPPSGRNISQTHTAAP